MQYVTGTDVEVIKMNLKGSAVEQFLASLGEDRRRTAATVRNVIAEHLPVGYEEVFNKGMLCYQVPPERYGKLPKRKPLMYAALAARKAGFTLHLMTAERRGRDWIEDGFHKDGKKLDLGGACIRFQESHDLPLGFIGSIVAASPVDDYIAWFEASRGK